MSKWGLRYRNDIKNGLRFDPSFYLNDYWESQKILEENDYKFLSEFIKIPSSNIDPKKTFGDSIFHYIDISSVDNSTGIIRAKEIVGNEAPSRARRVVQKDDIIVSSVRPDRNTVALITEKENGYVCSTGFLICRPNKNKIRPGFLFILLKSSSVVNQLIRRTTATMYPTINKEDLLNVVVKVPDLQKQEDISRNVIKAIQNIYESEEKVKSYILEIESMQQLKRDNQKIISQTTITH